MYSLRVIPFLAMLLLLSSCTGNKAELYQGMIKIDAHVHIRTEDPAIMEYAMKMNGLYPNDISWLATLLYGKF